MEKVTILVCGLNEFREGRVLLISREDIKV